MSAVVVAPVEAALDPHAGSSPHHLARAPISRSVAGPNSSSSSNNTSSSSSQRRLSQPQPQVKQTKQAPTQPHLRQQHQRRAHDGWYGHEETSRIAAAYITDLFACPLLPPPASSALPLTPPSPPTSSTATVVAAAPPPPPTSLPRPPLPEFVAYCLHRTKLPHEVTLAALVLLGRLKATFPTARGSSGHRLFLCALMIASKVICDDTYSNRSWTIVGQSLFSLTEVNQMERELLGFLGWGVTAGAEEVAAMEARLKTTYAPLVAAPVRPSASTTASTTPYPPTAPSPPPPSAVCAGHHAPKHVTVDPSAAAAAPIVGGGGHIPFNAHVHTHALVVAASAYPSPPCSPASSISASPMLLTPAISTLHHAATAVVASVKADISAALDNAPSWSAGDVSDTSSSPGESSDRAACRTPPQPSSSAESPTSRRGVAARMTGPGALVGDAPACDDREGRIASVSIRAPNAGDPDEDDAADDDGRQVVGKLSRGRRSVNGGGVHFTIGH